MVKSDFEILDEYIEERKENAEFFKKLSIPEQVLYKSQLRDTLDFNLYLFGRRITEATGKIAELLKNIDRETLEEIAKKQAEQHPTQTNADKFKEVFGAELYHGGCLGVKCPFPDNDESSCKKCRYYNFWEQEYKEPKGEDE